MGISIARDVGIHVGTSLTSNLIGWLTGRSAKGSHFPAGASCQYWDISAIDFYFLIIITPEAKKILQR
jgi:hypothetical protein